MALVWEKNILWNETKNDYILGSKSHDNLFYYFADKIVTVILFHAYDEMGYTVYVIAIE